MVGLADNQGVNPFKSIVHSIFQLILNNLIIQVNARSCLRINFYRIRIVMISIHIDLQFYSPWHCFIVHWAIRFVIGPLPKIVQTTKETIRFGDVETTQNENDPTDILVRIHTQIEQKMHVRLYAK